MMRMGVFSAFLLAAAWQDMRKKEIEVWIFWLGGAAAVGLLVWDVTQTGWLWLCKAFVEASVPGVILLICGKLSNGAIGAGDGWFFLISGWFLGLQAVFLLLCGGIFLCGSCALVLFFWKRVRYHENAGSMTLPFLPFVAISWLGLTITGWIHG